jgi:hypothetical protein
MWRVGQMCVDKERSQLDKGYYVYIEGGIGDIINNHRDPASGIGYAASAKEHGCSVTCLINSPWSGAIRSLLKLNPHLDGYVLLPASGPVVQADLSHKVEIARELRGPLMGERSDILADSAGLQHREASLYLSASDVSRLGQIGRRHVAIQTRSVGASTGPEKEWPDASWETLLWSLQDMIPDYYLVLLGTEETRRPIRHPPTVLDLTGATTIREAMAIVLEADAMIGIDSFLRCAAYHMGTPSVVLYEPPKVGAEEHFRGYFKGVDAPQHRVIKGHTIAAIEVAQVCELLMEALKFADVPRNGVTVLGHGQDTVGRRVVE